MNSFVINKTDLSKLLDTLAHDHLVIGPRSENGVIVLGEITNSHIPSGYKVSQGPGYYRLTETAENSFSFVTGPDSLKKFLHPSFQPVHEFQKSKRGTTLSFVSEETRPYAFFGIRACDMKALKVLDRVFARVSDEAYGYYQRKKMSLIIAMNCTHPGDTCFCSSVGAGPEVNDGYDIALTELKDSYLVETGTKEGNDLISSLKLQQSTEQDASEKSRIIQTCRALMKKTVKTDDLPDFLYRNFDPELWLEVAGRCLACGNCTQVCPTCFCNSSFEYVSISGMKKKNEYKGQRLRVWDSCFSKNFARVHGGNFRISRWSRYRHWFMHKLGYWIDQFGVIGCVGCGRCITWCPVGIDITEELQKVRNRI